MQQNPPRAQRTRRVDRNRDLTAQQPIAPQRRSQASNPPPAERTIPTPKPLPRRAKINPAGSASRGYAPAQGFTPQQGYTPTQGFVPNPPQAPAMPQTQPVSKSRKGLILLITAIAFALLVTIVLIVTLSHSPSAAPQQGFKAAMSLQTQSPQATSILPSGVTIAKPLAASEGYSLVADAITGTAPMSVTFTLTTNLQTQAVRLMRDGKKPLTADAKSAPVGDGKTWLITVSFFEPFTGYISAMLRHDEGQWSDSGLKLDLNIQ